MRNIRQINERNQITLPAHILKVVGLKQGDFIEVAVKDTELVLKPKRMDDALTERDWNDLNKLVQKQIKAHAYTEYTSPSKARVHLKKAGK